MRVEQRSIGTPGIHVLLRKRAPRPRSLGGVPVAQAIAPGTDLLTVVTSHGHTNSIQSRLPGRKLQDYLQSSMVWPSLLGVADLGPLSEDSSRTKLLCDFGRVSLLGNELVARAWLDADYSRDPETGRVKLSFELSEAVIMGVPPPPGGLKLSLRGHLDAIEVESPSGSSVSVTAHAALSAHTTLIGPLWLARPAAEAATSAAAKAFLDQCMSTSLQRLRADYQWWAGLDSNNRQHLFRNALQAANPRPAYLVNASRQHTRPQAQAQAPGAPAPAGGARGSEAPAAVAAASIPAGHAPGKRAAPPPPPPLPLRQAPWEQEHDQSPAAKQASNARGRNPSNSAPGPTAGTASQQQPAAAAPSAASGGFTDAPASRPPGPSATSPSESSTSAPPSANGRGAGTRAGRRTGSGSGGGREPLRTDRSFDEVLRRFRQETGTSASAPRSIVSNGGRPQPAEEPEREHASASSSGVEGRGPGGDGREAAGAEATASAATSLRRQYLEEWASADARHALDSARFDEIGAQRGMSKFKAQRTLDIKIKELLGPDGYPLMPIEAYMADPYNMVSLVGPLENARRLDEYFWDVRVGDIPVGPIWSVVPTCRIEMRFLPDRGLQVRSCRVVLDPTRLPDVFKEMPINILMDISGTLDDPEGPHHAVKVSRNGASYRIRTLSCKADLQLATTLPPMIAPILQQIGSSVLNSVLLAIQIPVGSKLERDFHQRAEEWGESSSQSGDDE